MAAPQQPPHAAAAPGPPGAPPAARDIVCGVLLFPGFEPLDVAGPVSVFGSVPGVRMVYIAPQAGNVTSVTASMTWVAAYSCADMQPPGAQQGAPSSSGGGGGGDAPAASQQQDDAPTQQPQQPPPRLDWLLVPGGVGTRVLVADEPLLSFLRAWCAPSAGLSLIMSVCTGSALLAAAGVLDGRRATSNKVAWAWVTSLNDRVCWVRRARWVRDGPFLTSSGVAAGTDAAVFAVKELLSAAEAAAAAKRLEHLPVVAAGEDPFADEAYVPAV